MEEIEVKFLDVDVQKLKERLVINNAQFIDSFEYRRKVYDLPDKSLAKEKHAWIRLRDEGEKVMLAYKQRIGVGEDHLHDTGMKEIELEVSDFGVTDQFLKEVGFVEKFYEENNRERYLLDNVEIDIDTWPMIPEYVELEGNSWEAVEKLAKKLGLDWSKHLRCSTMQIYAKYGINENDYSVITFIEQIKK